MKPWLAKIGTFRFANYYSGKDINRDKYQLHFNYCIKHVTKCPHCYEPVETTELQAHIEDQKGSRDTWIEAIK